MSNDNNDKYIFLDCLRKVNILKSRSNSIPLVSHLTKCVSNDYIFEEVLYQKNNLTLERKGF